MKKITKKDVLNLLIKKANGFYFFEEQLEYEKKQKKSTDQTSIFDNYNFQKNANYSENNANNTQNLLKISKNNAKNENKSEKCKNQLDDFEIKQNSKNLVTVNRKSQSASDMIELSDDSFEQLENSDLQLIKKKISKHYVPPDMVAIKILFEIFKDKVDKNEIENLSDEELLKLKNQLLEELNNEDF